ncbi:hypothetical protein C8J57DRAFT_1475572 [Mycena rebaudengoi]|nr:hypothetical protein C8J57DRAFT_1475572 [Mycena rebaudengoi]
MEAPLATPTPTPTPGAMSLARTQQSNHSSVSMVSALQATSLEVCSTMYGDSAASSDTIDRFYEPSATLSVGVRSLTQQVNSYENPVLTATSRSLIADIHQLSRQLSAIDVPRPVAMFCTLLRLQPPRTGLFARNIDRPLFQALRVWTEIGDLCENESFDGHRKTIVEHTLHILVLPGLHRDTHHPRPHLPDALLTNSPSSSPASPAPSFAPSTYSSCSCSHPHAPALPVPGTALTVPSPLHFTLHVITRLSFNEQNRITHHRDFWDLKDVVGLVPGAGLAQWVAGRVAARGVAYAAGWWKGTGGGVDEGVVKGEVKRAAAAEEEEEDKMERGGVPAR